MSACGGGDSDAPEVEAVPAQTSAPAEPDVAPETAAEPDVAAESSAEPDAAPETAAEPAPGADADGGPFADALLTDEEFPLDGFTRGEVTAETGSEAASEEEAAGALDDLTQGQDLSAECEEALQFTDAGQGDVGQGSSVDFTSGTESDLVPTSVGIAVAPLEGDSPLEALSKVSGACDSLTLDEGGQSIAMNFNELEELEGTEISVEASGLEFGIIIGGEANDDVVVLAFATGVEEADVAKVVEAQLDKIESAG